MPKSGLFGGGRGFNSNPLTGGNQGGIFGAGSDLLQGRQRLAAESVPGVKAVEDKMAVVETQF